uniref:Bestrophin homolog n=1 Tax=Ascaris lumbricoides TaxID=6252 RepID=A0A9J2Q6Y3_ASCLU
VQGIKKFREGLGELLRFDWVPLPIAYPQLIYLAVHVHFILCLISKQETSQESAVPNWVPLLTIIQFVFYMGWTKVAMVLINPFGEDDDDFETNSLLDRNFKVPNWVPLLTIIQFVFYMGWTKVAMVLINPFGEDDDDFETNSLLDRNFKLGIRIVDATYNDPPEQKRDVFWDEEVEPLYSEESAKVSGENDKLIGSTAQIRVPESVTKIVMIPLNGFRNIPDHCQSSLKQLRRRASRRISVVDVPSIPESALERGSRSSGIFRRHSPVRTTDNDRKYSPSHFSSQGDDFFANQAFNGEFEAAPKENGSTPHVLQDLQEENEESKGSENSTLEKKESTTKQN